MFAFEEAFVKDWNNWDLLDTANFGFSECVLTESFNARMKALGMPDNPKPYVDFNFETSTLTVTVYDHENDNVIFEKEFDLLLTLKD